MEQKQNLDFKALSLQMQKGLGHIGRLRKLFRVLTSIVYLATLVWFGFCLFGLTKQNVPGIGKETGSYRRQKIKM